MGSRLPHMSTAEYFERPPEKLVLEGYRCWTRGFALRSAEPWIEAERLYCSLLGPQNGSHAVAALSEFVGTLGRCAVCPLRMFRSGSHAICRDETLVMGLIAGIQNGYGAAVELCLHKLCCPRLCDAAAMGAGTFALTLKAMDAVMMPIPLRVIANVMDLSMGQTRGEGEPFPSRTLH